MCNYLGPYVNVWLVKNHFRDWPHTGGAQALLLFGLTGFSSLCDVMLVVLLLSTVSHHLPGSLAWTVVFNAGCQWSLGGLVVFSGTLAWFPDEDESMRYGIPDPTSLQSQATYHSAERIAGMLIHLILCSQKCINSFIPILMVGETFGCVF